MATKGNYITIFCLLAVFIHAINSLHVDFKTFMKDVLDNEKCTFIPSSFGEYDKLDDFAKCISQEGNFSQLICNEIMELEKSVCKLIDAKVISVEEKDIVTNLPAESDAGLGTTFADMCSRFKNGQIDSKSECLQFCTSSNKICDLYSSMRITLRKKFRDLQNFTKVDLFTHGLHKYFPYPPVGSLHSGGSLESCVLEKNETKSICQLMKEVAERIETESIDGVAYVKMVQSVAKEWNPCDKFSSLNISVKSIFEDLLSNASCANVCSPSTVTVQACKALYLGLESLVPEKSKATKKEPTANEIKMTADTVAEEKKTTDTDATITNIEESETLASVTDINSKEKEGEKDDGTNNKPDETSEKEKKTDIVTTTKSPDEASVNNPSNTNEKTAEKGSAQSAAEANGPVDDVNDETDKTSEKEKKTDIDNIVTATKLPDEASVNNPSNTDEKNAEKGSAQSAAKANGPVDDVNDETDKTSEKGKKPDIVTTTKSPDEASLNNPSNTDEKTAEKGSAQSAANADGPVDGAKVKTDWTHPITSDGGTKDKTNNKILLEQKGTKRTTTSSTTEFYTTAEFYTEEKEDIDIKDESGQKNVAADSGAKKNTQFDGRAPDDSEDGSSGIGFMSYFLVFTVLCVAGYIVFHNKHKIIALVVEGKGAGQGRRPSSKEYRKLKTEDVMPSLEKSATSTNYVY